MNKTEFRAFNRLAAKNTKALLADNFLDTIGKQLSPNAIPLNALEEVLFFYGGELTKAFAEELDKADANAEGTLTDSMRFEIETNGRSYELRLYMEDHGKYVDQGVKGVNSSALAPNSPYQFKFINPSKSHVEAIERWIKKKNVRAIIVVPKGISSKMQSKSLAYIFARAAKKRGLRATYFKKKAIDRIIDDLKADIAKALEVDFTVNILFE